MQADQTTSAGDGVMRASAGTLVLRLGYRGAGFAGFAEQPGQRTVAGELRRALQTVLRRPVELECAGRTDAGVSALAQFLSLPLEPGEELLEGRRLHASLVALTPDDISIAGIYRAEAGFSARFDARGRSYRYRICPGPARHLPPPHAGRGGRGRRGGRATGGGGR